MTESTQTLEQVQAEIAALKEQQKLEAAQRELEQLKTAKATPAGNKAIAAEQIGDLKLARVRQGMCGVSHFFGGPLASFYYGAKTGHWVPTLVATGAAVVTLPVAIVDAGFTFAVAPPLTSAMMLINKSSEKRRQLGILMPEQADAMMAQVTRF